MTLALVALAMLAIPRLGASDVAEVAPLAALTPKAITLGKLLANPLIPALLVSSLQQNLSASYGRLRTDKPLFWSLPSAGGRVAEPVPVLPCAEGIAQFTLNHPGATRFGSSGVRLLPAEGRPDEMVVLFAPDGYVAFALTTGDAERALSATAAARRAFVTRNGDPILKVNIGGDAFSAVATSASVGTNRSDVVEKIDGLEASVSLDTAGITISADVLPKPGVAPESLCADLEKSLGASLTAFGASEGVRPVCRFTPSAGKARARISLSATEMKKAGKAFNAAVVQSLATEKKGK